MSTREIDTLRQAEDGSSISDHDSSTLRRVLSVDAIDTPQDVPKDDQGMTNDGRRSKSFLFGDIYRIGWGECLGVHINVRQSSETEGHATTNFIQRMRARRSDIAVGPDVTFQIYLLDKNRKYLKEVFCGNWDRACGEHPVTLSEGFYFYESDRFAFADIAGAKLFVSFIERVHGCG